MIVLSSDFNKNLLERCFLRMSSIKEEGVQIQRKRVQVSSAGSVFDSDCFSQCSLAFSSLFLAGLLLLSLEAPLRFAFHSLLLCFTCA